MPTQTPIRTCSDLDASAPLNAVETNCRPTAQIAVFRNVFSVILHIDMNAEYEDAIPSDIITFSAVAESNPKLKSRKEKLVLEASKHYRIIS